MLVLTRKKGERVMIGDDIVITVIDVRGDGVRVGFDAPRGVKIQRAEVVRAVTEANTEAAANTSVTADLMAGLLAARARPVADQAPAASTSAETTAPAASTSADTTAPAAETDRSRAGGSPKPAPPRRRS